MPRRIAAYGKSTPDCSTQDANRLKACSAEFA